MAMEKHYFTKEEWADLEEMIETAPTADLRHYAIGFVVRACLERGLDEEDIAQLLSKWGRVVRVVVPSVSLGDIARDIAKCKDCPALPLCSDVREKIGALMSSLVPDITNPC